jgi:hypothetical protein
MAVVVGSPAGRNAAAIDGTGLRLARSDDLRRLGVGFLDQLPSGRARVLLLGTSRSIRLVAVRSPVPILVPIATAEPPAQLPGRPSRAKRCRLSARCADGDLRSRPAPSCRPRRSRLRHRPRRTPAVRVRCCSASPPARRRPDRRGRPLPRGRHPGCLPAPRRGAWGESIRCRVRSRCRRPTTVTAPGRAATSDGERNGVRRSRPLVAPTGDQLACPP